MSSRRVWAFHWPNGSVTIVVARTKAIARFRLQEEFGSIEAIEEDEIIPLRSTIMLDLGYDGDKGSYKLLGLGDNLKEQLRKYQEKKVDRPGDV